MSEWDAWIGRSEVRRDRVDEVRLARWLATFDRVAPADETVPQGFHWCLCPPDEPTARLGPDGHPIRDSSANSFLPSIPLPRRMWAASEVEFYQPLLVGDQLQRCSRVVAIEPKHGSSGALVFVDVEHEIEAAAGLCLRERRRLV